MEEHKHYDDADIAQIDARGKSNTHRTVTFEEEPTGSLLSWLENNAVLQQ